LARAESPSGRRTRSVTQAVERDSEDVLDLSGLAGILAIPPTIWITSERSVSGRTSPACCARPSRGLPGRHERRPADLEQLGVAAEVLEQLVSEGLLGGQIGDEPM
jgi:hypothetical protein